MAPINALHVLLRDKIPAEQIAVQCGRCRILQVPSLLTADAAVLCVPSAPCSCLRIAQLWHDLTQGHIRPDVHVQFMVHIVHT